MSAKSGQGNTINELIDTPLTEIFTGSSHSAAPTLNARPLVNYLWLDSGERDPQSGYFLGVPASQLEQVLTNAQRYPEVDFKLWLDFSELEPGARQHLSENPHPFTTSNLRIESLETIPDYLTNPLTQIDEAVEVRSDMARLQVLSHTFKTTDHRDIFYADCDCKDVKVTHPQIQGVMESSGFTVGLYYEVDSGELNPENGFLGFRRGEGSEFLDRWIIPAANEYMFFVEGEYNTSDFPILMQLGTLHEKRGTDFKEGLELLAPCGEKLPPVSGDRIKPFISQAFSADLTQTYAPG
ncbi:MAG: hypothetical protein IPH06_05510 [Alphaproteobacteria bacterium]|nr:hypothetical protein [Alphaproteobacteria bacterium]QQS57479.1 MAG: hypothetical protein IPN28_01275 [Alphaproteobacteria bacterium]